MSNQFLFANNAGTTLADGISSGAPTLAVSSGQGALFPSPAAGQQFAITLISATNILTREIVYCTARSTDTFTIVRAQEGTTALAWNAGDLVQNLNTAGTMASFQSLGIAGSQVYATAGSYTFTVPSPTLNVEVTGGGGGSGGCNGLTYNCGTSGGGGGKSIRRITGLTVGASVTVTVGAGGTAGTYSPFAEPGDGGQSSFGSYCTANGGTQGQTANGTLPTYGGGGGSAASGDVNLRGGSAGTFWVQNGGAVTRAAGGSAAGNPAQQPGSGDGAGVSGPNPGDGAGGAVTETGASYNGAAGAAGLVYITWP
jgi:hypothetical protein